MKAIFKRMKSFKIILCTSLMFALVCSLAACGTSEGTNNGTNSDTPSTQTASEAFSQGGIWYRLYGNFSNMDKDSPIKEVYVFENNMVTVYSFEKTGSSNAGEYTDKQITLTPGDLNGLSEDEILAKVEEAHEALFEASKSEALDNWQSYISTMETVFPDSTELQSGREQLDSINSMSYTKPTPISYELSIETDDTGNYAESEELSYTIETPFYINYNPGDSDVTGTFMAEYERVNLEAYSAAKTVYDTLFAGYAGNGMFTIVNDNTTTFTLDDRNSEGVTVD